MAGKQTRKKPGREEKRERIELMPKAAALNSELRGFPNLALITRES